MTKKIIIGSVIVILALAVGAIAREFLSLNGMSTPAPDMKVTVAPVEQGQIRTDAQQLETSTATEDEGVPPADEQRDPIGRITKVYPCQDGRVCMDADYVEWLTDKDAIRAALEDNGCGYEDREIPELLAKLEGFDDSNGFGLYGACAPNGYYVRNKNPKIRTLVFDQYGAKITYGSYECFPSDSDSLCFIDLSPTQFNGVYNGTLTPPLDSFVGGFRDALYYIKIENGVVVSLMQQYQP